jgi:crotonobetainyl-CoA:carnitine CoA-transferase CaiB-like acyl-CoA transferase
MSDELPLHGIKVLDATQGVAGPHSTMLLAQHGADVVKLEPLAGEWGRGLGKMYGDLCAHAVVFNRGKRSLAVDLKVAEGGAVARQLARTADVVVESFRPGVMARFGLGYDDVRQDNPEVIYLSVTGFGQHGPNRDLPVTDAVIQAFSGLMSINRDAQGTPQRIGMVAIDVLTGVYAYQAIASALIKRLRFGGGQYIDCSLMQCAAAFQSAKIAEHYLEGGAPQLLYVPVGTMRTSNGYINITAMREQHYVSLMEVLGRPELADDERYNTRDKRIAREAELMPIIREAFVARTTEDWAAALTDAGVMNSPVATYDQFMSHPHVAAVGSLAWANQDGVGRVPLANIPGVDAIVHSSTAMVAAPHVGQHTEEILREHGFSDDDIDALVRKQAIGIHRRS